MEFELLQLLVGGALFLATAYALQRVMLGGESEWPERAALGVALAFLVPGLLLLLLNLGVRFPINTLTVYGAYVLVGGAALTHAEWKRFVPKGVS